MLTFIAFLHIYERMLMHMDVSADRSYAKPQLVNNTHELGFFVVNQN